MEVIVDAQEKNEIGRMIAEDLKKRLLKQRHLHGGDHVTFTILSADHHYERDYLLGILPSSQFLIHLLIDNEELFIPRAGDKDFYVLLYVHNDGELACRLTSKTFAGDERYKGTADKLAEFVDSVGLAIKLFLERKS
jgi:hypothetical protein